MRVSPQYSHTCTSHITHTTTPHYPIPTTSPQRVTLPPSTPMQRYLLTAAASFALVRKSTSLPVGAPKSPFWRPFSVNFLGEPDKSDCDIRFIAFVACEAAAMCVFPASCQAGRYLCKERYLLRRSCWAESASRKTYCSGTLSGIIEQSTEDKLRKWYMSRIQ